MTKNNNMNLEDGRLVGRRWVAEYLGFRSLRSVERLEKSGELKRIGIKGQAKYRMADVVALVKDKSVN